MDAKYFIQHFKPYRRRYTQRAAAAPDLFGEAYEWKTFERFLSPQVITRAIIGEAIIGWFTNTQPNVLGVDIDDHSKNGSYRSAKVLETYDRIRRVLPKPSCLVRSPRGLHAYWLLKDRIPASILKITAESKLSGIHNIEVKPTPSSSLRIPKVNWFLDPETLLPVKPEDFKYYHPAYLFDNEYLPEYIRTSLQDRKKRLSSFRKAESLYHIERNYTPFIPGGTNEALKHLVPVYRSAGLSIDEAVYRLAQFIKASPLYEGELQDPRRLEQRVRSFYRHTPEIVYQGPKVEQLTLFHEAIIQNVSDLSPFAKQRQKPIERFLSSLLRWCEWHDVVMGNPILRAEHNYLYPFYIKNRKAGFYPLPKAVLEKWNQRYFEIMGWLLRDGFLIQAPFKYLPHGGICKYYRVTLMGSAPVQALPSPTHSQ